MCFSGPFREREFFIDNLLVRIHLIIEMIWRTSLAPWEFEFPFTGSLTSTFLGGHPGVLGPCASPVPFDMLGRSLDREDSRTFSDQGLSDVLQPCDCLRASRLP